MRGEGAEWKNDRSEAGLENIKISNKRLMCSSQREDDDDDDDDIENDDDDDDKEEEDGDFVEIIEN